MESNILFSIKPKYMKLIKSKDKKFEYRNVKWNVSYPSWFYIYESSPISCLKYKILLDEPIERGNKIDIKSYGTEDFNNLNSNRKYAYHILKLKIINKPISLKLMRSLNVYAPQDYIYINRKKELNQILKESHFNDLII